MIVAKKPMKDEQIIANQARKIAELEEQVEAFREFTREIHCFLYCIGAPLNDNKYGLTKEQLRQFVRPADALHTAKSILGD